MKIRNAINESNHELYDIIAYYLIGKNGYSPNVKTALQNLYKIVLEEINKEEKTSLSRDLVDFKTYEIECTEDGKTNTVEIDWDCFLLNDLMESYFGDKRGCYPKPIEELINKLTQETLQCVVKKGKYLNDDAEFVEFVREYEYEEDNE